MHLFIQYRNHSIGADWKCFGKYIFSGGGGGGTMQLSNAAISSFNYASFGVFKWDVTPAFVIESLHWMANEDLEHTKVVHRKHCYVVRSGIHSFRLSQRCLSIYYDANKNDSWPNSDLSAEKNKISIYRDSVASKWQWMAKHRGGILWQWKMFRAMWCMAINNH